MLVFRMHRRCADVMSPKAIDKQKKFLKSIKMLPAKEPIFTSVRKSKIVPYS